MSISIEQAQNLIAIHEEGSFSQASQKLKKRHSALIHSIHKFEEEYQMKILNREQYRVSLNEMGLKILAECQKLVLIHKEIDLVCKELKSGWEPNLKVIIDGILPIDPLLNSIKTFSQKKIPTKLSIHTEFHSGVENAFFEKEAHLMLSVLPPTRIKLNEQKLPKMKALLVAHKDHPLNKYPKKNLLKDLEKYHFLTVKGSHSTLNLSTEALDAHSTFHFNDFHTKKQALLAEMGFGWMPEYLILKELEVGKLKLVRWQLSSVHYYEPKIYFRSTPKLGRAANLIINEMKSV